MQNRKRTKTNTRSSLIAACAVVGLGLASSAYAAGDVAATSGYLTIQPNAANTAYVYTFSWVARDTDNNGGGAALVAPIYTDTGANSNGFGNGSAALDTVTTLAGGDYTFDNSANGGNLVSKISSTFALRGETERAYQGRDDAFCFQSRPTVACMGPG